MNLIGYIRVSTEEQGKSGLGLEAQRAAIEAGATAKGATLEWVEEVKSAARTDNRPELLAALERACSAPEVDGIIVSRLDRLSRSVVDFGTILERLQKAGVSLIVLEQGVDTSTLTGRMVGNILMAVAQWEREVIGERTSAALQAKIARGERVGREREIPEHIEREIIDSYRGNVSYERIARRLNMDGIPTVNGGPWSRSTVQSVVERNR